MKFGMAIGSVVLATILGDARALGASDSLVISYKVQLPEWDWDLSESYPDYLKKGLFFVAPVSPFPEALIREAVQSQFNQLQALSPDPMRCYTGDPQPPIDADLADWIAEIPKGSQGQVPLRLPQRFQPDLMPGGMYDVTWSNGRLDTNVFQLSTGEPDPSAEGPSIQEVMEADVLRGLTLTEVWDYRSGGVLEVDVVMAGPMELTRAEDGTLMGYASLCKTPLPQPGSATGEQYDVAMDYLFDHWSFEHSPWEMRHSSTPMIEMTPFIEGLLRDVARGFVKCFALTEDNEKGGLLSSDEVRDAFNPAVALSEFDLETGEYLGKVWVAQPLEFEDIRGVRCFESWSVQSSPFAIKKSIHGLVLLAANYDDNGELVSPGWKPLVPVYFEFQSTDAR